MHYFKKLKNYHKTIGNENKESEKVNFKEYNKTNEEQSKKVILNVKTKTSQKGKEQI